MYKSKIGFYKDNEKHEAMKKDLMKKSPISKVLKKETGDKKGNRSGTPSKLRKLFDSPKHKKAVAKGRSESNEQHKFRD